MHLCSLCCAPRCCARNGWSLTIISLIARMCQPSCQTNPIISIIPFLGFQVKKRSFLFLSLRKVRSFDRGKKKKSNSDFVPDPRQYIPHSINETWIEIYIFFIDPGPSRPRRGSFSLFSHPARGYDALRILEERGRTRGRCNREGSEKRTRRKGTEVRSQSREPTGHDIVDESRVQVGSTGWWCHSIFPFSKNTNCRKWRQRTLLLAACCCTKHRTCRALRVSRGIGTGSPSGSLQLAGDRGG